MMIKYREVNIVSKCARSLVTFRMIGLSHSEKLAWEGKLASVSCEWVLQKTNDYVYLCNIDSQEKAEKLETLLKDETIPFAHGIFVALVTHRGKDVLRLAPFVSEFYRCIGGTVDFSFVCGWLRRKVVFRGRKHREVNIVSGKAESRVVFHMEGLNRAERLHWEKKLASFPCEWHYLRRLKSYGCSYYIESLEMAKKLETLLDEEPIPFEHGINVSMVTVRDNDGLRLASFVAEFYRHIGGTMDFSLECGS